MKNMAYTIKLSRGARKFLNRANSDLYSRIRKALQTLRNSPRGTDCKKLKGNKNEYRIRVGDYRVVYEIHDNILVIMIVRIAPRDKAYE